MYGLQLLHHKLMISACGLFTIDYPLICSVSKVPIIVSITQNKYNIFLQIVGAFTTYIVILIQFDMSQAMRTSQNNTLS